MLSNVISFAFKTILPPWVIKSQAKIRSNKRQTAEFVRKGSHLYLIAFYILDLFACAFQYALMVWDSSPVVIFHLNQHLQSAI